MSPVEIDLDGNVRLIAGRRFAQAGETREGLAVQSTDERLTDAREPTAHATEHADGGADEITTKLDPRAYAIAIDTLAGRPTPTIANEGRLFWASDELKPYINDSGGGWVDVVAYPWIVEVPVLLKAASDVGWASYNYGPDAFTNEVLHNARVTSSGAQNDEIVFDVVLSPGSWELELVHHRHDDRGIYTITWGVLSIGTIDGYTGVGLQPNVRSTLTFDVAAVEKRQLTLKMATQNGLSSGYLGDISALLLRRTS